MRAQMAEYSWEKELEKTVVSSLTTTFGLDFLLFEDKIGGDVNTVNNVRQGVWATDKEKSKYENRGEYDSSAYHSHKAYKEKGKADKELHKKGQLEDPYRNKAMSPDEVKKRDLDHTISAKEIHDDAGRVLAGKDGVELANTDSNLNSTHQSINRSKNAKTTSEWLDKLPDTIATEEKKLNSQKDRLDKMPRDTPEQQHKARELESKIKKQEEKLEALKEVDADAMRKKDKKAREAYNYEVNKAYYTSSKFFKDTGYAAAKGGALLGARQVLGLVLAEVWFEFREQAPEVFSRCRREFDLSQLARDLSDIFKGIWNRVKLRFKDFLNTFKDGVFAGAMSSLTTTIFNIFATTQKMAIKIIREMWSHLVRAIKLIAFNPDQLSVVDLSKAVVGIISVGISTVIGVTAYTYLLPLCSFPFGEALASFASALITGVLTVAFNYFLLYSKLAQKVWDFVAKLAPHGALLRKYEAANAELDRYLLELSAIEFNLDADELEEFSQSLTACNDELSKAILLKEYVEQKNIDLPYDLCDVDSGRQWLSSLV